MKPFVIYPEGDLFFIMQVCPDVLTSTSGECRQSLWCDCLHGEDGPLWQDRGYFMTRADAQARCDVLTAQFWSDVERSKLRARRALEREGRLSRGDGVSCDAQAIAAFGRISPDDVPY